MARRPSLRNSPEAARPRPPLTVERLEDRITPVIDVTDTLTAVTFAGDAANNTLTVRLNGNRIEYSANGAAYVQLANARADTVTSVVVTGGAGNDGFDLSQLGVGLTALAARGLGASVSGGGGNDTLVGTGLNDTLTGGAGQDTLVGGSGDDLLNAVDWEADLLSGGLGQDAAHFESTDHAPVSVEVWNPFTPAADNQRHKVKVLVLNYDPLIPSQGNKHLYELFPWWGKPQELAAGYEEAMERTSGGYLDFEVVEWRNVNEIPAFSDGSRYTPDQYYQNRLTNTGWNTTSSADVPRIWAEQNVVPLVDAGVIDEVWTFGDHYFAIGGESFMSGPGAFFINGPTYPSVPSSRPFAAYGFSYERQVAEMLHNTSHRTEATMNRVYGGWNLANPVNNWERYSANAHQSNGVSGVGTGHYPANGTSDYDYGNTSTVQSFADDYLDYPHLDGVTRPVSRTAWSKGANPDYHRDYMEWYFHHLPRAAGVNPDGKQNNWWKYLFDFNNYTASGQPLPLRVHQAKANDVYNLGDTAYTFTVAYSGAVPVDVASLDGADVAVTAPDGTVLPATLIGVSDPTNGTYRVATYRVTPPGGNWDAADRGLYTIRLVADQVWNTAGARLPAQQLAAFHVRTAAGGPLPNDADTTLLLRFDNSTSGAAGETPTATTGLTYQTGVLGQAARFTSPGYARYATSGNVSPAAGTVEFWLRPEWNTTDPGNPVWFSVGTPFNNAIQFQFDDWADWAKLMIWGDNPDTTGVVETNWERNFVFPVSWAAGQWQHLAVTWDQPTRTMSMYLNGAQVQTRTDAPLVNTFSTTFLSVGASTSGGQAPAAQAFDEFRISNRARSAGEIAAAYRTGVTATALALDATSVALARADSRRLTAIATAAFGGTANVSPSVRWASSNPAVAAVDAAGTVRALAAGAATITATLDTLSASAAVTVSDTNRPTATLTSAPNVTAPGNAAYQFAVTYTDNTAVSALSLNGHDVRVVGPNGFSRFASLVSVSPTGDGSPRTATYQFSPPNGDWDYTDNGTYRVLLTGWQVADTGGVFAAPTDLGSFAVAVPRSTTVTLSTASVSEGAAVNTVVGTLSATDPDPARVFTFTLPSGAANNSLFNLNGNQLRTSAVFDYETQASYTVVVRATDQFGLSKDHSLTVTVLDVPAPVLTQVRVNGTTAPSAGFTASRLTSLVLTFNTPVAVDVGAFALSNGAFTLSNTAGGGVGGSGSGTTVTLTFAGASGVEFGSLRDGIWTLTTDLTKVRNAASEGGAGTATTQHIRRLYGDGSGDGSVTLEDYERFGAGFGTSGGDTGWATYQVFDFNADGTINLEDYEQFGNRFGTSL